MSASEFRIPYQPVSSSQPSENTGQFKICRCGEGDPNSQSSEAGDSPPAACPNCQVLKSGHLLLSSKGIGWTTWKKRWFILTRASLVFFRSDPNQPPRGNEPIVTLGGIDLNNSGSVVVKEDRKLLTVLFPDGRDGRTFTLKAETTEELNEWRSALESALAQAPSVANTVGQNPIFSTDGTEPSEAPTEQSEDKSSVIGRPAQFSLVDPDGSPSFLEKALRFIEDYGVKVEGILRQSADVEEVKRRFRDYEKGKNEFSAEDDGHVIGDCIKCILREMPASPIPASCCTALVTAYRADKTRRLDAINKVVYEVFPEPNRQLLQRILKMMMVVGSHKAVNRMSNSALAACMAPLLLRPLLLGECEIDSDFSMAGDGSFQLLQAAAAANHAQAIIIIMLEEYDQIFDDLEEGSCSSDAYTESDDGDVDKEYSTDNENHDDDGSYDSGEDDIEEDLDDNSEHSSGGSECDANSRIDAKRDKIGQPPAKAARTEHGAEKESNASTDNISKSRSASSRAKLLKSSSSANRSKRTLWGRTSARKDLSTEEVECCSDDEALIEKLENNKADLQSKVSKEVKENANLRASLEKRKESLHERRIALEKEVENLRDQLQKERSLRTSLESGLMNMRRGQVSFPSSIDSKTKADLEEVAAAEADILNLKQKACDLRGQLSSQAPLGSSSLCESCNKRLISSENPLEEKQEISSSAEASSIAGFSSVPRLVPGTGGMAELVEQLRRQATQHSSSTGAQRLARQNSNSPQLNRLQGPNAYSSIRTEEPGGGPPTALAKLTNRLNFLKERRALLASEMQNLDMARPPAAPPTAPAPNKDST